MQRVTCHLLNGLGGAVDFAAVEIDEDGRVIRVEADRAAFSMRRDAPNLQSQFLPPGPFACRLRLAGDAGADPVAARVNNSECYRPTSSGRAGPLPLRSRGAPSPEDYLLSTPPAALNTAAEVGAPARD